MFVKTGAACWVALSLLMTGIGTATLPAATVCAAPQKPAGVPAGGKGSSEAAAIEMMKQEALKKVLAQLTAWSDDPCPPVACCQKRNIRFCGECDAFPCEMMAEFYGESDSHKEAYERMRACRL